MGTLKSIASFVLVSRSLRRVSSSGFVGVFDSASFAGSVSLGASEE